MALAVFADCCGYFTSEERVSINFSSLVRVTVLSVTDLRVIARRPHGRSSYLSYSFSLFELQGSAGLPEPGSMVAAEPGPFSGTPAERPGLELAGPFGALSSESRGLRLGRPAGTVQGESGEIR